MAKEIKMPDLGTAVKQVTLLKWCKEEGEFVKRGEIICEVETDKATTELESIAEGVLLKQVVPADSEVEVGTVIAYVGQEGESISASQSPQESAAKQDISQGSSRQTKSGPRIATMVRNLAAKLSVDLDAVQGSGPGGRITCQDVKEAKQTAGSQKTPATCQQGAAISKNQLGVARTITKSWQEIVPISVTAKVDMSAAMAFRQKNLKDTGEKVSFDAILIHAVSKAARDFPCFKCYFDNDSLVDNNAVNIGLAISLENDLFVPVIKNADQKTIAQIDQELRGLVDKAGKGTISIEDMAEATFTISNLGMYAIESFTAIIPPHQSGVLTIGRIEEVVRFAENNSLVSHKMATLILSVDHRFINGRQAAEALTYLKDFLESL